MNNIRNFDSYSEESRKPLGGELDRAMKVVLIRLVGYFGEIMANALGGHLGGSMRSWGILVPFNVVVHARIAIYRTKCT